MQTPAAPLPRKGLSNILGNLGWILGGKGFGAVCSLAYLAVLSQSLGVRGFGHFALIFGTGQALVAIVGFQTWKTLVRFGAEAVHRQDWARFGRLVWLCGTIDAIGATLGCVLAGVIYYGFADLLDLNPDFVDIAFLFSCVLLWARQTTPNGIVRVLDRFDMATYVEALVPVGRLVAALAIMVTAPAVRNYLIAWALIDLLNALVYWVASARIAPYALRRRNFGPFSLTLREHPGVIGFFGITYAGSFLDALFKQGPLLAVGHFLGPSAAGIYRLADQLAQGFSKISQLLSRAVYPEFARARLANGIAGFRRLVLQVTAIAGGAGLIVTVLALLVGADLLALVGGAEFARGGVVLIPLIVGAAFDLAGATYEPILHSLGHAFLPLLARALAGLALVAAVLQLAGMGAVGIGWAVALGFAIAYLLLSLLVFVVLRRASAAA
ncbi:polysaccharide biosynthesis family protein [Croceibacterium mercuriale]|uniref:Polysaccharide biosynthesis family protein n=1 Tax=Croceibacterium mercuriale TaxID=1572751 RepID=A0A0B2BW38_9SPHN|nr:lipopolysaccharide biosynthesis protein [Croceibacterium mercuriale]KHL25813.1 polysaccharide biosynthesis family protein [Croceibacterium mercuriale]